MRADRLVATLLLLQSRGRVTAAEVAGELEVSAATARRDLAALGAAGVPVYPQAGRGGGWSLVGGARTDLSGLTASEAQALFLLLGPAAEGPEVRSALRKLVRALPGTFRADAEAAARAVLVDPAGWGGTGRKPTGLVQTLQAAVVRRRKVHLDYTNRAGERTQRLVDPWGLVDKDDVWYLVAGTDNGQRTFRIDRIVTATGTERTAEWPDGFDLPTAWERISGWVEEQRSLLPATVLIPARWVPVLRSHFGRHCEVLDPEDGDRGGDGNRTASGDRGGDRDRTEHGDRGGDGDRTEDGGARSGPGGGPDGADDRPAAGRVGRGRRGAGTGVGAGRAGPDRRRAHRPLRHLTARYPPDRPGRRKPPKTAPDRRHFPKIAARARFSGGKRTKPGHNR